MKKSDFKILTEKERADVVRAFLHTQEMDKYLHTLNIERYRKILSDPELPDGEFKEKVQALLIDSEARLLEVELIIRHTS